MPLRVVIRHETTYRYDRPVRLSPQVIRLHPSPHGRAEVLDYQLKITPTAHRVNWLWDAVGNRTARAIFPEETTELAITVTLSVAISPVNPFDFFLDDYATDFPFTYPRDLGGALHPYFMMTETGPELDSFWAAIKREGQKNTISFLTELLAQLHATIAYTVRPEPGVQPCALTLRQRSGSCRDTAWLLVQLLRRQRLAARFVSGYQIPLSADTTELLADTDAQPELHAWAEVYLPGAGWVGLDPTSGLFTGAGYVPLAVAHSPEGAAAVTGTSSGAEVTLGHSITTEKIS